MRSTGYEGYERKNPSKGYDQNKKPVEIIEECSTCKGSMWVMVKSESVIPTAMRCRCQGGPESLVQYLKTCKNPDYALAKRVEQTFISNPTPKIDFNVELSDPISLREWVQKMYKRGLITHPSIGILVDWFGMNKVDEMIKDVIKPTNGG